MAGERSPFRHRRADDSAGFLLWKLTSLWQADLARVLDEFGITQTQYAILASLRWFEERGEPPTQAHLVTHARIEKMTLSKAVRRLEDDGLLVRERSHADSRAWCVRLTSRGRKVVQRAAVAVEDADDAFFAALAPRDLASYKVLTRRLVEGNAE